MKCRHETPCSHRCLGTKEIDPCRGYDKCKDFQPDYKTNADRIRAMSDEELASMFNKAVVCHSLRELGYCHKCPLFGAKPCDTEGLLDWLRQPVKDGDNDG